MNVLFEELSAPQRAGGIEAACAGLGTRLGGMGHEIVRHDSTKPLPVGWRPNVVHVHGIWSPALIGRWQQWRAAGMPCMITVHGMLQPWALAHKKWKKRVAWPTYQKRMLQSAHCLHATSEIEARSFRRLGLRPPVVVIPWGIDAVEITKTDARIVNCEPTMRMALFVGRLYPVKGLPLLLEAWAKVGTDGWRLRLVGPNEAGHQAELEVLCRNLGLSVADVSGDRTEAPNLEDTGALPDVTFTGGLGREALAEEYRRASLFILPSQTENFGFAVGEAMAHGLPVITTQGAPWELLENERCGWWAPVSVEGIAAALDDATRRTPEELAAMGERGRAVVAERFAWDRVAREMIACYEWVLGRGPKPGCVS